VYHNFVLLTLQTEMDKLVEQMNVERITFEKAQEEQKATRAVWMTTAALRVQSLFRGYRYDRFYYCQWQFCRGANWVLT